ncbi:unnamed protein product [Staurois parvus]|uniref:Uncharacterized protein n=1 Tax=Staurois parvus TaxID=386267 RepID=A0ABN9AWJ3_9NEOB|nr:unnamed protein product [Staurois parvus]
MILHFQEDCFFFTNSLPPCQLGHTALWMVVHSTAMQNSVITVKHQHTAP